MPRLLPPLITLLLATGAPAGEPWIELVDESASRLVAHPSLGLDDLDEKDYAWGDVDHDGDMDLVVARKQPFSSPGGRPNVLLMNEGVADGHAVDGVLVDRTAAYVSAADDGGDGFLDATNDRDVVLADVNGDTWLDIVTATNFGLGVPPAMPKTLSHPRVYVNQGERAGLWQGYLYEEARIPTLPQGPNFSAVAVGDVTGDGAVDLYFVDYYSILEDRLLVNDGTGVFADMTSTLPFAFTISILGTSAAIADLNGDGAADIIKVDHHNATTVAYNDPATPGSFTLLEAVDGVGGESVAVADLDDDGRPDLVVVNEVADRYLINRGNDPDGTASFVVTSFPDSIGFAGNAIVADLDADGLVDVLVADVEMDLPGCGNRLDVQHNLGGAPEISFDEDVGNLPASELTGVHDVAVLDLDGDGALDLVLGRCLGTRVWINQLCLHDLDGSDAVGVGDLLALLAAWGTDPGGAPDFDGDGVVGVTDLLALLAGWGACR